MLFYTTLQCFFDELENQNESEVKQPELDEHNTILKETSSNNNRCTGGITFI
jgi:predicted ATPase